MQDLISRQAAIDKIHEHMEITKQQVSGEIRDDDVQLYIALHIAEEFIKTIPSAEPERKTPDHGYMWICPVCGLEVHSDFARCVRCGWERPTAEPERKRGRWEHIYIKRRGYTRDDRTPRTRESAYCTACRAIVPELKKISRGDSKYRTICNVFNFCPNCGADMRGGEDETD